MKSIKERKTQKLTLAMRPSVVRDTYKIVYMKKDTLNNLINVLLEKYISNNQQYIQMYDRYITDNKNDVE